MSLTVLKQQPLFPYAHPAHHDAHFSYAQPVLQYNGQPIFAQVQYLCWQAFTTLAPAT
jgi:hypothetical protein